MIAFDDSHSPSMADAVAGKTREELKRLAACDGLVRQYLLSSHSLPASELQQTYLVLVYFKNKPQPERVSHPAMWAAEAAEAVLRAKYLKRLQKIERVHVYRFSDIPGRVPPRFGSLGERFDRLCRQKEKVA